MRNTLQKKAHIYLRHKIKNYLKKR